MATVEPVLPNPDDASTTLGIASAESPLPRPKPVLFYAKAMTAVERFSENIFFVFLAFVIMAGLLNVFIRRDIQHPDLIVRTLVLTAFFLMLLAARDQTFLHLTPGIL